MQKGTPFQLCFSSSSCCSIMVNSQVEHISSAHIFGTYRFSQNKDSWVTQNEKQSAQAEAVVVKSQAASSCLRCISATLTFTLHVQFTACTCTTCINTVTCIWIIKLRGKAKLRLQTYHYIRRTIFRAVTLAFKSFFLFFDFYPCQFIKKGVSLHKLFLCLPDAV